MGRRTDLLVGTLATLVFVGLGLTILGFSGRSISYAIASANWPTVSGQVQDSGTREDELFVRYTYEVEGESHESTRIGFDVFDNPGGRGRRATVLARYPVGAMVRVHVRPGAADQAVLETGDVAPFLTPSLFGLMFLGFGLHFGRITARRGVGAPTAMPVDRARRVVWVVISVVLTLILGGLVFDGTTQEVVQAAFGPWIPAAVPAWLATLMFVLGFTVWLPVLLWHGVILVGDGVRPKPLALVVAAISGPPEVRRTARWAVGALLYFVVICGAWIAFASWRGV
ncbi:DUF3592 domain-containing protein [Enhygromyxa salina]|uniref:DUF3592 domain-containing protein n=1 Tax=Enhygromyxa salina TaxID=215803 RepID=UPI0015E75A58|nr:DUF3592 domain-containing protein [Enhygromyxa salina]